MGMHVEYVGFTTADNAREYTLRAQEGGGVFHDFVRAIPLDAFVTRRARYQDAPEICFLKLQTELAASPGTLPDAYVSLTDLDLEQYRVAHAPKPPNRRPKPVAPPV